MVCSSAAFLCFAAAVAFKGFSQVLSGFGPSQQANTESTDAIYVGAIFVMAAVVLSVKLFLGRAKSTG